MVLQAEKTGGGRGKEGHGSSNRHSLKHKPVPLDKPTAFSCYVFLCPAFSYLCLGIFDRIGYWYKHSK